MIRPVRRAVLLLPLAFACRGGEPDPTIASAPTDAPVYVRVRSWEEVLSAAPFLRASLAMAGEEGPPPRASGIEREAFDDRLPFGIGLRKGGLALVLRRKEASAPVPSPSSGWGVEALAGGALGVWQGPKPTFGPLPGGDLPDGLLSARLFLPMIVEVSSPEIERAAGSVNTGLALAGGAPEGTLGETVAAWRAGLRALGTLDLSIEAAGGRFDALARLRPDEGSGFHRFARSAKSATHTLAGFLSKEGTILFAESSVDPVTFAAFFPKGFLGVGPVPFAPPGSLGTLVAEAAALQDGREAVEIGHAGGDVFIEFLAGLRDPGAYAALVESDRFANAIEGAVSGIPFLQDVVYERNAFHHSGAAVHRLRFALREGMAGGLPGPLESLRAAIDRFGIACCAVVDDLLVAADGADAETRIRALLDRIRSGRLDRPGLAATLGSARGRLAGIALDLGEARNAFLRERAPMPLGGRIAATLEARDGVLEVAGTAELRSLIPSGMPGMPR
ncbi:MAG TPA: hypothetical protein VFI25_19655 [Planctomycetota bacterium]|nr:hypothetical protein [Planctomycetota bacterium]